MTDTTALRLGIIGAGSLASGRIYPCLHLLPARLAAVCDHDETRARRVALAFGAEHVYLDHRTMLAQADLDAVVVCVGALGHPELAIEVLEAGLPVYTEKPPAVTAADVLRVVETSRRTGQICMTAFCKRFAPAYRRAHDAVHSEAFGTPSLLMIDWCSGPWYTGKPDNHVVGWFTRDPNSTRTWFLLDFAIHMIDMARYLFGEVAEVSARRREEQAYAVTLSFANGAVGTLGCTQDRGTLESFRLTERVEVTGSSGQSISIPHAGKMVRYDGGAVVEAYETAFAVTDSLVEQGYVGELQEFLAAVRERREPEASIESSYRTMLLYEAIERSADERAAVQLPV
jgi:myo-inositol 2-dehydrogenase/D-chiro-inositol 1-dehydrogenase